MDQIKKLDLMRTLDCLGSRYQWLSILENGDLMLDGYDLGEGPLKFWGKDEYEYWYKVEGAWKDTILLLLLKDRFGTIDKINDWLKERGIPAKFGSWL